MEVTQKGEKSDIVPRGGDTRGGRRRPLDPEGNASEKKFMGLVENQ